MHTPKKFDRRNYLKYAAAGSLAVGAAVSGGLYWKTHRQSPLKSQITTASIGSVTPQQTPSDSATALIKAPPPESENGEALVSIGRGDAETDVEAIVRKAVNEIGGMNTIVSSGERVVVKPPVLTADKNCAPDARVVQVVVKMVIEAGGDAIVAESSGNGSTDYNLSKVGITRLVEEVGATVRDLQTEKEVPLNIPGGLSLHEVKTFPTIRDCDVLISVPRLKRHNSATVTISLKNMMGTLPKREMGRFHSINLSQCIADLNTIIKPALTIIDGTMAMTRSGPTGGDMVKMDTIIASRDTVAADRIGAQRLQELEQKMGLDSRLSFNAADIKHVKAAAALGIGIENLGNIKIREVIL